MQAWLFYDNQDFWKPPQIKASTFSLFPLHACEDTCLAENGAAANARFPIGWLSGSIPVSDVHMNACDCT